MSIPDIFIELVPLSKDTWLNSCMAGQHFDVGRVSFRLLLTYTVFPKDFRDDARLVCSLSEGFPRMSLDMRMRLDMSEGDQPRLVAKKPAEDEAEDEEKKKFEDAKRAASEIAVKMDLEQETFNQNHLPWGE